MVAPLCVRYNRYRLHPNTKTIRHKIINSLVMSKLFSEKAFNAANIFARIHKLDYIKYCGK